MTTTVKVTAHGHRVKVTQLWKDEGQADQETILEPNTPERQFHVHSSMDIKVEEIPADTE